MRLMSKGVREVIDYETIYRQYFSTVYRYMVSICHNNSLSEELTQATFFAALKRIDSFRADCTVQTWLIGIARNQYFDYYRKQKRFSHKQLLSTDKESHELDLSPEEIFFRSENINRFHYFLHLLAEPYKEVFTLRIFSQMNFAAIGALFSKSEGWACVTYYRAKQKLQSQIREDNHNE